MFAIKNILCLLFAVGTLYSGTAVAAYTCSNETSPMVVSMPLPNLNLYAGNDVASNYRFISNQQFLPSRPMVIFCEGSGEFRLPTVDYKYLTTPKPAMPLDGYPSTPYQTGMPGTAVWMSDWSGRLPGIPLSRPQDSNTMQLEYTAQGVRITLQPIGYGVTIQVLKSGVINYGNVYGSHFPTVAVDLNIPNSVNSVRLLTLSFRGSQSISAQTCKTPNLKVPMGKHDISKFKQPGSTTGWVNSSIQLTDCPVFYGRMLRRTDDNTYYSDDGTMRIGDYTQNRLDARIIPATEIIDSAKGIMAIKSGSGAASGIGIQLGWTTMNPINFNSAASKWPTPQTGNSLSFAFVARYIQTEENVTPGRADATATFIINYN